MGPKHSRLLGLAVEVAVTQMRNGRHFVYITPKNSSLSHAGCMEASRSMQGVKSIPPTTENWLQKRYNYSVNNDTSTEDKHETNHINNKYNDMNMNTRKMHNI